MANTEGMTDEVMNELLSSKPAPASRGTSSSRRPLSSGASLRRQRLNMPMGERPAATVIRRSNRSVTFHDNPEKDEEPTQQQRQQEEEAKLEGTPSASPVIIGGIVERPIRTSVSMDGVGKVRMRDTSMGSKSMFAQRRQPQSGGFPSTKMPIGTFAKKRTSTSLSSSSRTTTGQTNQPWDKKSTSTTASDNVASTNEQEAIRREADAMLAQMSNDEIQENIADLQSTLSPEMITFLRNRKAKTATTPLMSVPTVPQEQQRLDEPTVKNTKTSTENTVAATKSTEMEEKERMAHIMSSIRTYDDLDMAYAKEIGPTPGLEDKSEWDQACSLLRSTSPRQTLWAARLVCRYLEDDVTVKNKRYPVGDDWPYPLLLPISLRCLLDAPVTHTNGLALHGYVLRSIYALLRLRAPEEHVVDVNMERDSSQVMHQTLFLEDAIPTSAFGTLYPKMATTPMVTNADGEALAYSTASSSTSAQQDGELFLKDPMWTLLTKMRIVPCIAQLLKSKHALPEEGFIAIAGILAMLSVRSPGAASAISQHSTLFQSLLKKTIYPDDGTDESHFLKPNIMLPIMILLNNMARQSRVVASKIPYMDILPPLLAISGDKQLISTQLWALLLWRKLLRYGIGLSGLSSLVALSIQHLGEKSELASAYCTLFAAFLDCVRVTSSGVREVLTVNDQENLNSAFSWMTPSVQRCIQRLNMDDPLTLQSSMFRLVASYAVASTVQSSNEKCSLLTLNASLIKDKLTAILDGDVFQTIIERLPTDYISENQADDAMVCSYLSNLVSLVTALVSHEGFAADSKFMDVKTNLHRLLLSRLAASRGFQTDRLSSQSQLGWVKHCQFVVTKFLIDSGELSANDHAIIRLFAFALIGNLDLGDEAKAAMLFSEDLIFEVRNEPSGPLSNMFMRELCTSEFARKQLDHSFKLQRGVGITSSGWGPFATESLLSDCDMGPGNETGLLPMGKTWLWQVLCGSLGPGDPSVADEVCNITSNCLGLLTQMVHESELRDFPFDAVPTGAKLYFLLTIFLYPENILCNEIIRSKTSSLLDKCSGRTDKDFALEFIAACFNHSQGKNPEHADQVDPKDEKLLAILMGTSNLSSRALRLMTDFCIDLCTSFTEFGAQYEEFTKAIRTLLRPQFPSQIRCEVLERLREVSHLLTLESEENDSTALISSVEPYILTGKPPDGEKDSSKVLNLLADILRRGQGGSRGFFFLFATATLSRALIFDKLRCGADLHAQKRRLGGLPLRTKQVSKPSTTLSAELNQNGIPG